VLLLEAQDLDPAGAPSWWPVEIAELTYQAIKAATDAGIIVIEPAGNGGNDLDNYTNLQGQRIFDRNFRDSGAIMVGAGSSANPHTCLDFSNFGNRVDCYAWGENIDTTDFNDYTTSFDGTSGASAIIAGAALIVQGLAKQSLGRPFTPQELRGILTANGTPLAGNVRNLIGVMPDLQAIISQNNLVPAPAAAPLAVAAPAAVGEPAPDEAPVPG